MTHTEQTLKNQVALLRRVLQRTLNYKFMGYAANSLKRDIDEVLERTGPEPSMISRTQLTNTRGNHYKQYIVTLYDNNDVLCEWGKINGTKQKQWHRKAGRFFASDKVLEKEGKGYDRD